MKTTDKIVARLPRFYRATEESSYFYYFVSPFAKTINEQEELLTDILRSHWVSTASNSELDLLASTVGINRKRNEPDIDFRTRIKRTLVDRKKSGTVEAIRLQLATFLATSKDDIVLIENPITDMNFEKKVVSGDSWTMTSGSINDEEAQISITIEDGQAREPSIIDLDAQTCFRYNGTIKKGDLLEIHQNEKVELNNIDVSSSVSFENINNNNNNSSKIKSYGSIANNNTKMILPRKPSRWQYQEKLTDTLGRFDQSKFDQNVFFMPIPPTSIKIRWVAKMIAAFEVRIPSKALDKNGLTKDEVEIAVNSMKAAGVRAIITLEDKEEVEKVKDKENEDEKKSKEEAA